MSKAKDKKKDTNVEDILAAGHFNRPESGASMNTDPVQPTPMVITLDDIETYDRNPRRMDNSAYDDIKQGLTETGSEGITLTITRRPGAKKYMPNAGGNTRLLILKELYHKTGDEKYYRLTVKFIPFTNESDTLINHLVENDVRGDYLFIDKSLGLRQAYDELCTETEQEYTQRDFIDYLKEHGYSKISRTLLILINYAVDHLYPLIPNALDGGIGSPKVRDLKRIESKYLDYWCAHELEKDDFIQHWQQVLSQNDSWDSFSTDMVETDILNAVTERIIAKLDDYPAIISTDTIRLEVNQYQKDPELVSTLSEEPNYGWPTNDEVKPTTPKQPTHEPSLHLIEDGSAGDSSSTYDVEDGFSSDAGFDQPPLNTTDIQVVEEAKPSDQSSADRPTRISPLRQQCYECATAIAKDQGFEALIKPLLTGYGYWCELPDMPFNEMDELKAHLWWQLFLMGSIHIYDNYQALPEQSAYRRMVGDIYTNSPPLDNEDTVRDVLSQIESSITQLVPTPSQFVQVPMLFESDYLDGDVFRHYITLQSNRRLIREGFDQEQIWNHL